jgi:hypothetical protein
MRVQDLFDGPAARRQALLVVVPQVGVEIQQRVTLIESATPVAADLRPRSAYTGRPDLAYDLRLMAGSLA